MPRRLQRTHPALGAGAGAVLVLALWVPSAAEERTYAVDPARSTVSIHVGRAGLLKFAGHEHRVLASRFEGEIRADPVHVESSSVHLTFETAALEVSSEGEPPQDVPKVQAKMLGPDLLDAERFPFLSFRSTGVDPREVEADTYDLRVTGTLTLHGVERSIVVPVRVVLSGGALRARGTLALRQTDYALTPVSVGGLVKVKNEVSIEFTITAAESRPSSPPESSPDRRGQAANPGGGLGPRIRRFDARRGARGNPAVSDRATCRSFVDTSTPGALPRPRSLFALAPQRVSTPRSDCGWHNCCSRAVQARENEISVRPSDEGGLRWCTEPAR